MTALTLPARAGDVLIDDVRRYGRDRLETGAFLLAGRTDPDRISTVALLGEDGVERRRGLFVVTAPVIDKLFSYAETHDLLVRSLVHSHEGEAFMSVTDKAGTIRVPGFVAAIIPVFADPNADPATWGWWTWTPPTWAPSTSGLVVAGSVDVIRCDATHVSTVTTGNSSSCSVSTPVAALPSMGSHAGAGRGRRWRNLVRGRLAFVWRRASRPS